MNQNVKTKAKAGRFLNRKQKPKFDDTLPLKERLKAKLLSLYFWKKVGWFIVRLVLLVGISYIVLYPHFTRVTTSLMAVKDFADVTVKLIPKNFTLDIYKAVWTDLDYVQVFANTLTLSLITALIQTFVCCLIAYGLAKFKFKGNKLVFFAVVFSLVIPHATLRQSMTLGFTYFDVFGLFGFLNGGGFTLPFANVIDLVLGIFGCYKDGVLIDPLSNILTYIGGVLDTELKTFSDIRVFEGVIDIIPDSWNKFSANGINLRDTYWPWIVLSVTGLAFKNGLYIFMLRQFYRGVPDELEESAYIDGSGVYRTFMEIILPLSVPMMITVFLFAFSWQWTDNFYTAMFFTDNGPALMPRLTTISVPVSLQPGLERYAAISNQYETAIRNTCGIMIIAPLIIMYLFCQRYLVQGIERSGLTAD